MEKKLHSSHIFMFPFRFDWNEKGFKKAFDFYKSKNIDKRIALNNLNTQLQKEGWNYQKFEISGQEKHLRYNEYAYFYDYAREAIYNLNDFSKDAISNYYSKNSLHGKLFELKITNKKEPYTLTIQGVTLRVFNTGVAILSLELDNHNHEAFEDILCINEFGRRVYPQFIGKDGDILATKNSFLADTLKIDDIEEDFTTQSFSDIQIGRHIIELLGQNIFTQNKNTKERYYIQPSLDDRMFVLSWYANETLSQTLSNEQYLNSDDWYKYVFVDTHEKTVYSPKMQKKRSCI